MNQWLEINEREQIYDVFCVDSFCTRAAMEPKNKSVLHFQKLQKNINVKHLKFDRQENRIHKSKSRAIQKFNPFTACKKVAPSVRKLPVSSNCIILSHFKRQHLELSVSNIWSTTLRSLWIFFLVNVWHRQIVLNKTRVMNTNAFLF